MKTTRSLADARTARILASNTDAVREILPLMHYAGCAASIDGDRVVFTSAATGKHTLDLLTSDRTRVLAHWHGFVGDAKNGGGWALIRKASHGESCECMSEDCINTPFIVATDFGNFCSGVCAESEKSAMEDARAESDYE